MKVKCRAISYNKDNVPKLISINLEDIVLNQKCILSIDGSTTCTGIGILRESDGAVASSIACIRDKREEDPVRYKIRLKNMMYQLLKANKDTIKHVYYEEPIIGYASAVGNLFMLRTFLDELKIEHEPELDHIEKVEISNQKWKADFLGPRSSWERKWAEHIKNCNTRSNMEKVAIKCQMLEYLPFLEGITQDEFDALGMGFVAVNKLRNGNESELKSHKKVRFSYNIKFLGCDCDDDMLTELMDNLEVFKIPQAVLDNGLKIKDINGNGTFENKIFSNMGEEDKLLILKFKSSSNGSVTLKYRIGQLASNYDYIYAVIWRKSRI